MTRRTSRQLLLLVILSIAGMTIFGITTERADRMSPVMDRPFAHLAWGLLIVALGALIYVDRDYALEIWWKRDPHRPSDRVVLTVIRAACVVLVAVGVTVSFLGLRSLLGRF
jgi:hypothetical protein